MEVVQRTLEVERVVNLISAFGWKVTKEDISDDKIVMTIEKTVKPGIAPAAPE